MSRSAAAATAAAAANGDSTRSPLVENERRPRAAIDSSTFVTALEDNLTLQQELRHELDRIRKLKVKNRQQAGRLTRELLLLETSRENSSSKEDRAQHAKKPAAAKSLFDGATKSSSSGKRNASSTKAVKPASYYTAWRKSFFSEGKQSSERPEDNADTVKRLQGVFSLSRVGGRKADKKQGEVSNSTATSTTAATACTSFTTANQSPTTANQSTSNHDNYVSVWRPWSELETQALLKVVAAIGMDIATQVPGDETLAELPISPVDAGESIHCNAADLALAGSLAARRIPTARADSERWEKVAANLAFALLGDDDDKAVPHRSAISCRIEYERVSKVDQSWMEQQLPVKGAKRKSSSKKGKKPNLPFTKEDFRIMQNHVYQASTKDDECGVPDWKAIVEQVSVHNATAWDCCQAYQRKPPPKSHSEWTLLEDQLLLKYMAASGPQTVVDGHTVTSLITRFFPHKTKRHVFGRINQSLLNPKIKHDHWTDEEERKLAILMKCYSDESSTALTKIATNHLDRNVKSVADKWNRSLNPVYAQTPFSKQEDVALMKRLREQPQLTWTALSERYFPHRHPQRLMSRWSEQASDEDIIRRSLVSNAERGQVLIQGGDEAGEGDALLGKGNGNIDVDHNTETTDRQRAAESEASLPAVAQQEYVMRVKRARKL